MADDVIDRLNALQEMDLKILQMERELAEVPARRAVIEEGLRDFRSAVTEREESLKRARLEIQAMELDIETRRQKILRLREQQLTLKTNREFKAMEGEIGAIETGIGRVETGLLEIMEKADGLSRALADGNTELDLARRRVDGENAGLDARVRKIETDAEQLRRQRETASGNIDKVWLSAYERLFAGRKGRVLVGVEKGVCGGCHMRLPPAVAHAARRAEALVTCDFCGRMLYSDKRMT